MWLSFLVIWSASDEVSSDAVICGANPNRCAGARRMPPRKEKVLSQQPKKDRALGLFE
jgi:hypothetical protein